MKKIFFILLLSITLPSGGRAELLVGAHNYLKPMVKDAPAPAAPGETIFLRVTPGEYEPASFAARSDFPERVTVTLEPGGGPYALPAGWCELHRVVSLEKSTPPNRLMDISGPVELEARITQFFWLTVRPLETAPAGTYHGQVRFKSQSHVKTLDISCEVLPFSLEDTPVTGGVFMATTELPHGWYRDMKEHGLDAIQAFWNNWGIGISRDREDNLVCDFGRMDRFMADVAASGLEGPVTLSLGNDHSLHYERKIAEAFDIPVETGGEIDGKKVTGPAVSPELDSLFVEGLRRIKDHWSDKGYPQELVVLIYDEPTERLHARCKHRFDLLKTVMPDTRVYGVVMNRREWAEIMADQCDIIVSDGDFTGCQEVCEKYHKDFWVYSFPLRHVHTTRFDTGCLPWRVQAQGVFFWMYNYWSYNPDGCAVYRHPNDPEKLVRSTAWEAVREGMDDLRYLATAEKMIARTGTMELKVSAARRLEEVRDSIDPNRRKATPTGEKHDQLSVLEHFSEPQRVRDEVIGIILDLL
ncbi:MAG: DUF4091 domain-containing protein [Gemmatimonadota bacterium]|nr:DUF4091 domain-containing protein [Gemmatimonadota bacterium]